MAQIIGGIGVTHVPAIGGAIAKGLQQDPYWKSFFDGFPHVHTWLAREKPDVAVVFYNEHGLDLKVLGTGGLSHQLDGERAGFINKDFDLLCMDSLVANPSMLTRYSTHDIVAQAGNQGVELLNWIAMRGALTGRVSKIHSHYHIPIFQYGIGAAGT